MAFSSFVCLFLVGFLVFAGKLLAEMPDSDDEVPLEMEKKELLGIFEVMGALLEDSDWPLEHPQPCTETQWPGVQCEIGDEDPPMFHVTKIHIGPDILTPPCKSSATLSESLLKLPYLKTLSIFSCFSTSQVTLSPKLFGALSSLEHLALVSNPTLSGEIPSSLAQISSLRVLTLSQNNLQGKVPSKIGALVSLEQLDLSYNNLSGQIPEEIGGLDSLTILDLSQNVLEGQLPSSFGQLQLLQKIDLSSNRLGGMLPPDIGKLNRLVLLDLSHNLINGPIPETLSGLQHLEYMVADSNPIKTEVPNFVGKLMNLKTLSFSECGLIGPLPNFLSSLKNLTALSLSNNSLTGTVRPNLGTLPSLDLLNLSNNQLSGELTLPEDFIERLGKRLVLRGNNGLCTSNPLNKKENISSHVIAPLCLNPRGPRDDQTLAGEHPTESERVKPLDQDPVQESSSTGSSWSHVKLNSFGFVFCLLSMLL
ncbi:putative leucine-rich repeat domain, L domain-containing protein [Rosa chinensis]|uniref:Putative leucine-rich repeat domain, L domain-containing protein n=1 Tax=Rosa chinensis TaxID=74649 RepID=A0A2P6Q5N3_ROSCH|nr:putative leucine-rich repeat domain, L domain-containing protein [Rosa chinensis]